MKKQIAGILLASGLSAMAFAADSRPQIKMETNYGTMVIELDSAKAPKTVSNILTYVKDGFYDGTIFHRVIRTFMIQGGGFTPDMQEKPNRAPVVNEAANGLKNLRGTIAMARTNDPNSATSQFFINTVDNVPLDYRDNSAGGIGYCVFGKVVSGLNVVDSIAKVATTTKGGYGDVPVSPVIIKKVTRVVAVAAVPKSK